MSECPWGTPTEEQWETFHSLGDVNYDGVINGTDLDLIHAVFGHTGPPGWIPEDLNKDGVVDMADISRCVGSQGIDICSYFEPSPPPPAPPVEIDLQMIGGIALAVADAVLIGYYVVTHIFR